MDTNALQRAILHHFGPEDALVKLSELVFFLGSWELSQNAKTNATVDRTAKTNSADHRTAAEQERTKRRSAPKGPQVKLQPKPQAKNATNTSNTSHISTNRGSNTSPSTDILTLATSSALETNTSLNRPSITTQQPQKAQAPSYASIVKNYKFQGVRGTQKAPQLKNKELYTPERLRNGQKQPDSIKIYILDPENLPSTNKALLANIASQQQQQSIKAIKRVTKRLLLVYPTTNEARQYLLNSQEWLQNIQGTISRTLYNVVIHNIELETDLEQLKKSITLQNNLQNPILAISRLGKSTTVRLGLQDLLEANTLIQKGIILDYEIKTTSLYQKKPIQKSTSLVKARKRFFKEPEYLQATQSSQDSQTSQDTLMEDGE